MVLKKYFNLNIIPFHGFLLKLLLLTVLTTSLGAFKIKAQKTYTENGGELIFSFADVIQNGMDISTKMRFTMFFHIGRQIHYDFNNNVGLYSGFGIRNVGYISKYQDYKEKRRVYSLGVPVSIKIGSFDDHFYFYTGAEGELFFHYKQKRKYDDSKSKQSEWFSNRTKRIMPSLFFGLQFPGGINLKFKYYADNFLNKNFTGNDFGQTIKYSDFEKTKLFYFALTYNIKTKDLRKLTQPDTREVLTVKRY